MWPPTPLPISLILASIVPDWTATSIFRFSAAAPTTASVRPAKSTLRRPISRPAWRWIYTSCNTGSGNTPEWMVDYPPINERIQAGFLNWTQGATGILYYRSDGWSAGNAIGSWNNVDTTACGSGLGRPGDAIFLYPPAPIASTESAPGIRLKAIRDGIQDYEYAQILKNLGPVPL